MHARDADINRKERKIRDQIATGKLEFLMSQYVRILTVLGVQFSSETLIGTIHRTVTGSCCLS